MFFWELDGIEPWATDIGNAFLEALTSDKVCIRAGLCMVCRHQRTSAYYLQSIVWIETKGKAFGQLLQECLLKIRCVPSHAEAPIYMRKCDAHYEYIATYINHLVIIMKDPQSLIDQLIAAPYDFKLKG